MERIENLLRLKLAGGIGNTLARRLLDTFGSVETIFGASEKELASVSGMNATRLQALRRVPEMDPRPELERAAEAGVTLLAIDDPAYPQALKQTFDPPFLLYVKGEIKPADSRAVGMVGTRRASRYGLDQAQRIAADLGRAGMTVISGLARGIDSSAHRGALAARGRTLAVLGCGLGKVYPPENRDLAAEIVNRGAVLSEFMLEESPRREYFPQRNRIIAGLSLGVLVVEAPSRSGALITARQATEMGREVFVMPGRIDVDQAEGCHQLIREGALLIRGAGDILEELRQPQTQATLPFRPAAAAESPPPANPETNLNEKEHLIYGALDGEPVHIDELCVRTDLPVHEISATLMILELRRLVRQHPGKFFSRHTG